MKKLLITCGVVAALVSATVAPASATTDAVTKSADEKEKAVKTFEGKYDVGGFSLYLNSQGKDKPVVVYDSGLEDDSSAWAGIQSATNGFAQSVRYDRAGLGQSDLTTLPRTSREKAIEMHTLLHAAKIKAPYILVGHSMGGVDCREFAALYPDEVAGVILVDSSHEDSLDYTLTHLTPEQLVEFKNAFTTPDGNFDELYQSMQEVRETRDALRNVPLTVVTTDRHQAPPEIAQRALGYQQDLASLSNYGKLLLSTTIGHYVQLNDPQLVTDAIRDMVETVEKKQQLEQ